VTELVEFTGRTHWIIAEPGWEEVAGAIERWLEARGVGIGSGTPAIQPAGAAS